MKSQVLSELSKNIEDRESARMFEQALDGFGNFIMPPSKFVKRSMEEFDKQCQISGKNDPSKKVLIGNYFEFVIGECLIQSGIKPIYYQAVLRHAQISKFDWFLYNRETPVLISCKTSAKDRWKQAAWEARDLKQLYTRGKCYLITIDPTMNVTEKLQEAPNTIDGFIEAKSEKFDQLIEELSKKEFYMAVPESPILRHANN